MKKKGIKYGFILLATLVFSICKTNSQILENPKTAGLIKTGVESIYNLDFSNAGEIYTQIKSEYPEHSVPYLYMGMMIYWRYFPLIPGSETSRKFEETLKKAVELAENELKKNNNTAENLLSGLGSVGLLMLYYADNGQSRNVISLAPRTYQLLMKSFDYSEKYNDFYFITGLYNYYREAYPEAHPIYKPIIFFFPEGDKKSGLKQLKIAADSSIFLKAESNSFLSGIYQSFENDPRKALIYSRRLSVMYPNNLYYKTAYIKDLLIAKRYNDAEKILGTVNYPEKNNYFQCQIDIFRGIIEEKKYKNKEKAKDYYWQGIRKAESYKTYGSEFAAYGYFGLSRIYSGINDKKLTRQYRKQAKDLAVYEHINFDN